MNKLLIAVAAAAAMMTLAACDTTSPPGSYVASTPNVLAFQSALKAKGTTVKVGQFTADPSVVAPGCRMAGTLDVTSGKPIEEYVKNALQTELFTAQVYDVNGAVTINCHLDTLKVNTFGTGSWTLGLQVTSNLDPVGYHVEATRTFATSYTAIAACQNATNAFAPTVQDLLGQVVNNPGFAKLTGRS